ncbi:MAG: cellulase family glycosylhydrolase, partial [Ruminococcus sp.]|nr:cellulase family glycosylhydrolase [Ruminococcus sp.]
RDGEISNMVYQLKKQLIDNGVPVIITEFGAVNKKGNDAEVAKWVKSYFTYTKAAGIPCVWWDNGYYLNGNELFGIYDRSSCSWFSQEVADALIENS